MKRTLRKIVSLFAVLAVTLLCLPEFASPVGSAKAADQKAVVYVDEDRTEQTVSSYTLLSGKSTVKEWKEGWRKEWKKEWRKECRRHITRQPRR